MRHTRENRDPLGDSTKFVEMTEQGKHEVTNAKLEPSKIVSFG